MSKIGTLITNVHSAYAGDDVNAQTKAGNALLAYVAKPSVTEWSKEQARPVVALYNLTPVVEPKAPKQTKPKAAPKETAKVHPMKGKSRLGLTPEQVSKRNALYESGLRGKEYHDACAKAGIPTNKNGLLTK